jgi:cellulose synthase operon protein C
MKFGGNKLLILALITSFSGVLSAADKEAPPKGLLPELRIDSTDENANQKKAAQSEVLITKTENQAIQALVKILKRQKGSSQEPELWNRLAELYMRRAKSGRFFDLNRDGAGPIKFIPPAIRSESAATSLKRAVQVYTKIEKDFPKYREMDSVLFNNAFASQQLKMTKNAEAIYLKLITRFPKSPLLADAYLALGELSYENKNFKDALTYFKNIEKYPQARVFTYGLYKQSWTLYNLKENEAAMNKLIQVVKLNDPKRTEVKVNHNLRAEALRDLSLFFSESQPANKAYSFFSSIASQEEVGEALLSLGKLYDSHSRQKEMNVFLADYIQKIPLSKVRIKMEILMILGNETARNRPEALKHLITTGQLCKSSSEWTQANLDISEAECDYDFAKANVEIAKKWWDLWQKNKKADKANEIAGYALKAFRVHLDSENPLKADIKSRYAYAELLFQLGDFRNASLQYEFVAGKSPEPDISHDASYGAIVSLEKAVTAESSKKGKVDPNAPKETEDDVNMVRLGNLYLQKHPKGEHVAQVKFKIGLIAYENQNFPEAEKWLRPLASDDKAGEFKKKSEDLVLDMLNARKDYGSIKSFSKQIAGNTKDESRKAAMEKIMVEANYSEIQDFSKTAEKSDAADKLVEFWKAHKSSPLAKDSLWQALSLYYTAGKVIEGADLAMVYMNSYPDDKRSLDAVKDAAKNYADNGLVSQAAKTMEKIAEISPKEHDKYIEAAGELYFIDGNIKEAQQSLRRQLADKGQREPGKLYAKLLSTMKNQTGSAEYQKIEDKIVALNHEPYASEIRLKRVEQLFAKGKVTEAFNASKSFVGQSGIDPDTRAKARLIQAKVLEGEFIGASTKTTVPKLATVLGIKTEKLDKAQSAYIDVATWAKDPNIKLLAVQGMNRIYTNYVDSVGHPILKDEAKLTPEDKSVLATELAKLTAPIQAKKQDSDKQLQLLAKETKAAGSNDVDFETLPADETVKPQVRPPSGDRMAAFLPSITKDDASMNVSRFSPRSKDKCVAPESDANQTVASLVMSANICATQGSAPQLEKIAVMLVRKNPKSVLGTFYLSIAAGLRGQFEKSAWLIDLSIKKGTELPFLLYQKARVHYQLQETAQANATLLKAHDLGLKTSDSALVRGFISYAQGDCISVTDEFQRFDKSSIAKLGLAPILGECHAQQGQFDKAVAFTQEMMKSNPGMIELPLELGRIQEIYRFDSGKAILAYEQALALSKRGNQASIRDWLNRKLTVLKSKQTVTVLEPQNVVGKKDLAGGNK